MHVFRNSKSNFPSTRTLSQKPEFKLRTSSFSKLFWASALLFSTAISSGCATSLSVHRDYPPLSKRFICSVVGDSMTAGVTVTGLNQPGDNSVYYGLIGLGVGTAASLLVCHVVIPQKVILSNDSVPASQPKSSSP